LAKRPEWTAKLYESVRPAELSPEDTARQMADTAKLGTRVLWLGHDLTAQIPNGSSPMLTRWAW